MILSDLFKLIYLIEQPLMFNILHHRQQYVLNIRGFITLFQMNFILIFVFVCIFLYLLHLYPGFYSYTEGATWKILDLLTETLLI